MKVIEARNVHEALVKGLYELRRFGIPRNSRNGQVLVMPTPVTTVYHKPVERVIFWPQRDANPFFHLYESLWMLGGRNDVAPLLRYAKNIANYADSGIIHGAYGHRWRKAFLTDQLAHIVDRLTKDPDDRRSVLQMWSAVVDLDMSFKDVPCNTTATFQRGAEGALDMAVFCRSNDIIWGAYGANAVHFSMLQEYLANIIGCEVGTYYQVSVNWHGYLDTLQKCLDLSEVVNAGLYSVPTPVLNPYLDGKIIPTLMPKRPQTQTPKQWQEHLDMLIYGILDAADCGFKDTSLSADADTWTKVVYSTLKAHQVYKDTKDVNKSIDVLCYDGNMNHQFDWLVAAEQWLERRRKPVAITTNEDND